MTDIPDIRQECADGYARTIGKLKADLDAKDALLAEMSKSLDAAAEQLDAKDLEIERLKEEVYARAQRTANAWAGPLQSARFLRSGWRRKAKRFRAERDAERRETFNLRQQLWNRPADYESLKMRLLATHNERDDARRERDEAKALIERFKLTDLTRALERIAQLEAVAEATRALAKGRKLCVRINEDGFKEVCCCLGCGVTEALAALDAAPGDGEKA